MAYTAWSVVYGEQPTAAKWNQLGTNDAGFKDGTNIDDSAIVTRHIGVGAVTTPKMKPTTFQVIGAEATRFVTSSTTYADVPGLSYTYTNNTGAPVRILLFPDVMLTPTATVVAFARITVNGSNLSKSEYYASSGDIPTMMRIHFVDVAAGASAIIKVQAKSGSAGTSIGVVNEVQEHSSKLTGIVINNT